MYSLTEILRAVDGDSLSDALSKMEIFARSAGMLELSEWARLELNGYQGRPEFGQWAEAFRTRDQQLINTALSNLPAYRRNVPVQIISGPYTIYEHPPMAYGVAELESSGPGGLTFFMGGIRGIVSSASIQTLFTKIRSEARSRLQQTGITLGTQSDGKPLIAQDNPSSKVTQERSHLYRIPMARSSMHVNEIKGKVHVAIITVRQDEYAAMEARLGETISVEGGNNSYEYSEVPTDSGAALSVVLTRTVTQGNAPAQTVAHNIIHELDPSWLFLVGIAGGVPDHEFCLGDVIVASYLHDFSLKAATEGKSQTYQTYGGPMHPAVERFLQTKVAGRNASRLMRLAGLLTEPSFLAHPKVFDGNAPDQSLFYGDDSFRRKVEEIITNRFPLGVRDGHSRIWAGPCANGDTLVKSATLLQQWQESARQVTHVETELAGVYAAARSAGRQNYPLLAIRGLSDVVGFRRDPAWTAYSCGTAAAIASAVLRSGFIDFDSNLPKERAGSPTPGSPSAPVSNSVGKNPAAMPQMVPVSQPSHREAFWAADLNRRIQAHIERAFAEGDREALERGPLLQISTPAQKYTGFVRFARLDRSLGRIVVDPNSQEALQIETESGSEYVPIGEVNGVRDPIPEIVGEMRTSPTTGSRSDRYRGPRR